MKRLFFVLGAAILSGLMLGLSLPPVHWYPLGWVCFAPLLLAVQNTRFIVGFLSALIAAATPAVLYSFGLMPVPYPAAGEPNWVFGGFMLFGIVLSIVSGVVAEAKHFTFRKAIAITTLAVVLEACLLPILPVHLALSQYTSHAALFIASFTGIWGVSALLWFGSIFGAFALKNARYRLPCIGILAFVGAVSLLPKLQAQPKPSLLARVAIIQTKSQDLDYLSTLNATAASEGAQLAVWPEMSGSATVIHGDSSKLVALSKQNGQTAFVTSFEDDLEIRPHNTAALFWQGMESARYFKRRPFGGEITMHTPGTRAAFAEWEFPVGLNICFDSCDPTVMRETAQQKGVAFIALPTQDPVAPGSVIQAIHASYTPFRAAELGVSIARADMTAYSMIVGPDGEIISELPPTEGIAVASIPPPHNTFYRHFGDWFLYLCVLVFAFWLVRSIWRRKANV